MDGANLLLAEKLLSKTYVLQGQQALKQRQNLVKSLLSNRRLPDCGWDDASIESLLRDLSLMDSNNFLDNVGMGEREARCASKLVQRRHYGMAHGMGRSGSITEEQPKAGGSTILAKLTNALVKDALEIAGLKDVGAVSVLPLATGMTLMLSLTALKKRRPPTARYVLWPRMDQKSCLKSILAAGLEVAVIPNVLEGDQLCTNVGAILAKIAELGSDQVVCVLTTTSCFATRAPDRVEEVAKLCQQQGVGHIINNAYGVQSAVICRSITQAWRRGRVDAVVQSTDKNFLVPVGGAVIAAGSRDCSLVEAVNRLYPGRASMSPIVDVFITLLSLGAKGWKKVLADREVTYAYLKQRLTQVAEAQGERVLHTPDNPISLALTLTTLDTKHSAPDGTAQAASTKADGDDTALLHSQEPSEYLLPSQSAVSVKGSGSRDRRAPGTTDTRVEPEIGVSPSDSAQEEAPDPSETPTHEGGVIEQPQLSNETAESRPNREFAQVGETPPEAAGLGGSASGKASGEGDPRMVDDDSEELTDERAISAAEPWTGPNEGAPNRESVRGGQAEAQRGKPPPGLTFFGSMLFARCVSGSRVIRMGDDKVIEGIPFSGYGSSYDRFPYSYMTAAAAIGATPKEVDTFVSRLERCFVDFRKKQRCAKTAFE